MRGNSLRLPDFGGSCLGGSFFGGSFGGLFLGVSFGGLFFAGGFVAGSFRLGCGVVAAPRIVVNLFPGANRTSPSSSKLPSLGFCLPSVALETLLYRDAYKSDTVKAAPG